MGVATSKKKIKPNAKSPLNVKVTEVIKHKDGHKSAGARSQSTKEIPWQLNMCLETRELPLGV